MKERNTNVRSLTMIALMAAVLCIVSPMSIPLPITLVPVSLGNFVVLITLYVLGMKRGFVSYTIYFLLGLVGLPVFSGFSGGLGKIAGPTGGYLVGYFFLIPIAGYVIDRFHQVDVKSMVFSIIGMIVATAVLYAFGTIWFTIQQGTTFAAALGMCVIPFIPVDLVKIVVVALIGPVLRKTLTKAGVLEVVPSKSAL